jgi:tripartite-type tricarboxylate transporter receptor subunit TctC
MKKLTGKKLRLMVIVGIATLILGLALTGCSGQDDTGGNNGDVVEGGIDFPTKQITVVVPYSAGGGSDLITRRLVQTGAEDKLGVSTNIVNMPGGSGAVGYVELAGRKADGYSVANSTSTIVTQKLLGNIDLNHRDFEIVIGYNYEPAAIGVNAEIGIDTLEDLVNFSKENPGAISLGTSAEGGIWNIAAHAAEDIFGVEWNIVPDGGGGAGPVLQAAGGQIEAVTASPLEIYTQEEAGNLKLLAVMADERLDAFPDVPTFKELGYDLSVTTTRSLLAPKGTPQEVIDVLYEAFAETANSQEYKDFLHNSGAGWMLKNGQEMQEYYDKQEKVFAKILQ